MVVLSLRGGGVISQAHLAERDDYCGLPQPWRKFPLRRPARRLSLDRQPCNHAAPCSPVNLFALLAGLVFLVVGAATLGALLVVALGMRRRPWRATAWRAGVCLLPMICVMLLYVWIMGPVDYTSPQDLKEAYHTEFGSDPPPDVTDFQVRVAVLGDWWGAWHRFRAAGATIDSLITKFEPTDRQSFSDAIGTGSMPGWWRPDADGVDAYYVAHQWRSESGHSEAYLGINRAKGVVYFYRDEF